MWLPWTEINKFGTVKSGLTGKAYHKFQISKKCLDKIFASILRFMLFLRARSDPQNDIMWFPWKEIDKFGTVESGLTGKGYHKC